MNCSLCKENVEEYLKGRLPEDMKKSLRTHLKECEECNAYFTSLVLAEKMVAGDLEAEPNPFLLTRIMARVQALHEDKSTKVNPVFGRILQPALITLSLAAAIFAGIAAGSLFNSASTSGNVPEEFVYFDDASLESLSLLTNE